VASLGVLTVKAMILKSFLAVLIVCLPFIETSDESGFLQSAGHEFQECLDRSDEEALIITILSEEKHIKGYLGSLESVGRDTIGITIPSDFHARKIKIQEYQLYFVPGNSHKTTLEIELSENCSSGHFKFGDRKYIVKGGLLRSNNLWSIHGISIIEIN
jgi:hypothetical protein